MQALVVVHATDATKRYFSVTPEKVAYLDNTGTATFSYYDSLDFNGTAPTAGFADGNYVAYGYYYCGGTLGTANTEDQTFAHYFRVNQQV